MPPKATKDRSTFTAQFAVRDGKVVPEEPLDSDFRRTFETQTDYEWKRIYPEPASRDTLRTFREGNKALREDRILDAIDAYERCLAVEDYVPARLNLAVAHLHEASADGWRYCEELLDELIERFEPQYAGRAPHEWGLTTEQIGSVLGPAYRNKAELFVQRAVETHAEELLRRAEKLTRAALAIQPDNGAWMLELWGILHMLNDPAATDTIKQAGKSADFEALAAHAKEKYTALAVKYHSK